MGLHARVLDSITRRIVAESEQRDTSGEEVLARRVAPPRVGRTRRMFAYGRAFGSSVAHGDGMPIETAVADATHYLYLMVAVLAETGEDLPRNDADGQPPTVLPDRNVVATDGQPAPTYAAPVDRGSDNELPYLG